jgi:uncharacterized surface protein with fasciclin (FAS1) repeats
MPHRRFLLIAAAAAMVAGCATRSAPVPLADTITATPSLSTFSSLIVKAGLGATLNGAGPFTVFAPTNDAFKAVPAKTMDALAQDPALLRKVLTYHVLAGKVMSGDVKNGPAKTVQGASVTLARAGTFVTVEESLVQTADIVATNGVVHTVDRVLIPPATK